MPGIILSFVLESCGGQGSRGGAMAPSPASALGIYELQYFHILDTALVVVVQVDGMSVGLIATLSMISITKVFHLLFLKVIFKRLVYRDVQHIQL